MSPDDNAFRLPMEADVNPFDLSASDLLIWGVVLHLIADWPLQNDWMANNKARTVRWHGIPCVHPAGIVHACIHGAALMIVFGTWPATALAVAHMVIDQRWPVARWSRLVRQTQPEGRFVKVGHWGGHLQLRPHYGVGLEVRFWTDQVFHIACIAIAALVVAG